MVTVYFRSVYFMRKKRFLLSWNLYCPNQTWTCWKSHDADWSCGDWRI